MGGPIALQVVGSGVWVDTLLAPPCVLVYHSWTRPLVRPRLSFVGARLNYFRASPGAILTVGTGVLQILMKPRDYIAIAFCLHVNLAALLTVIDLTVTQCQLAPESPGHEPPFALLGAAHATVALLVIAIVRLAILRPTR